MSSVLALTFSLTLTFFPFGFLRILNKPLKALEDENSAIFIKYGEIYKNLRYADYGARHYEFFFILRR